MNVITDIKGTFTLHNGVEMPYLGLGVYLSEDGTEVVNAVKWALDMEGSELNKAVFLVRMYFW
jgi:diketogulonate reductase-like aldo/keto reductase